MRVLHEEWIQVSDTDSRQHGDSKPAQRLANDICRCHDNTCPMRDGCLRWEQRDSGRVHAMGMMMNRETRVCLDRIAR